MSDHRRRRQRESDMIGGEGDTISPISLAHCTPPPPAAPLDARHLVAIPRVESVSIVRLTRKRRGCLGSFLRFSCDADHRMDARRDEGRRNT